MCNKNSTPPPTPNMKKTKKKIQQQAKDSSSSSSSSSSSLKPHRRRNRTKKRKPKYLSLRLQLSQNQSNQSNKATQRSQPNNKAQLNVFPHQPESPVVVEEEDDKEIPEENNVALLFSSDGGATLNGLLEDESTTVTAATSDDGSLSVLTCHEGLVRKAMRRRTRSEEGSEERWVCYSEVVEKKELTEEVTSSTATATTSFGSLSLKLDHEGILSAWSDKGSLYVAGEEAPQTVPDLLNNALLPNVISSSFHSDLFIYFKIKN